MLSTWPLFCFRRCSIIKIIEETYVTNDDGYLILPPDKLEAMGIRRGSDVTVAFLSEDGSNNSFCEFLLSSPDQSVSTEQTLFIPSSLLEQAGFAAESDLDIICIKGAIVLSTGDRLDIDELCELLGVLSASADFLRNYDDYSAE